MDFATLQTARPGVADHPHVTQTKSLWTLAVDGTADTGWTTLAIDTTGPASEVGVALSVGGVGMGGCGAPGGLVPPPFETTVIVETISVVGGKS